MPENALLAFADHGVVRGATILDDLDGAQAVFANLAAAGIDMRDVTERRLVDEGVRAFAASFDSLLGAIREKHPAGVAGR